MDDITRQDIVKMHLERKPRHVSISDGVMSLQGSVPRVQGGEYVFASPSTGKLFVSTFVAWNTARGRVIDGGSAEPGAGGAAGGGGDLRSQASVSGDPELETSCLQHCAQCLDCRITAAG